MLDKKTLIVLVLVVASISSFLFLYVDMDGDNLRTYEEFLDTNTSFYKPDTDSDGLKDGREVLKIGTDPSVSDSDSDDLSDGKEVQEYETDPLSKDTDSDGLQDGAEVKRWEITYKVLDGSLNTETEIVTSNPTERDTDGDDLQDLKEKKEGTNPRRKDTDQEGIPDLREVEETVTDPCSADTDEDGLSDFEEVEKYNTDPTDSDTDSDNILDGVEVHKYGSNPHKVDTDKDGLNDKLETSLPRANPCARDVFVEVDWTQSSQSLPDKVKTKLETVFANAPIKNPDGSEGVNLHIDVDEQVPTNSDSLTFTQENGSLNDFYDFKERFFTDDRRNTHHYALLSKYVTSHWEWENLRGLSKGGDFMVATYVDFLTNGSFPDADKDIGTAFMHELGHSLGLDPWDFDGIDSENYSYNEYSSVMNYNSSNDKIKIGETSSYYYYNYYYIYASEDYRYSHGSPFNDWAHLAKGFKEP